MVRSKTKYSSTVASIPHSAAEYTRTQRAHSMHPVCSVLTLLLPPKHCHTIYIARVSSLLPRDNSNFTAQCFKSNMFNGFCKQVCQLLFSIASVHLTASLQCMKLGSNSSLLDYHQLGKQIRH